MDMNKVQVRSILGYIENSRPEKVRKEIFSQLGRECFVAGNTEAWVRSFNGDTQAFIDGVNVDDRSPYWEHFDFSEDKSVLYLTGKPVDRCVCAFGECEKPPVSLCTSCCRTFQENIFGTLFGRKVEVDITESVLPGGKRCSTAIRILG